MKYTAGKLGELLGVSPRTIRFYDEKNILKPCGRSEAGYRLYDEKSVQQLQKILMLKYLNFSLEQIASIMQQGELDLHQSLREQELLLVEKKEHIKRLLDAVRKAEASSADKMWDNMLHVISMTKDRSEIVSQYSTDQNLSTRISLHHYSTSAQSFYSWLLERNSFDNNMKILDIGCGNATFWKSIASELPHNLEIHLVDYSEGMLESARKNVADILSQYPEKNLSFVIDKRDASDFNYPISSFDRIMANHVLFYLSKESRRHLYLKISNMLAEGGQFSCSLVGEHHMEEIHRLFHQQYPSLVFPADKFDILLETAPTELSSYFDVQESVEQENDLLVPDEHLVLQYVESFSQEIKEVIHADKEHFLHQMRQLKNGDGYLYIHKSTGNIICTKRQ